MGLDVTAYSSIQNVNLRNKRMFECETEVYEYDLCQHFRAGSYTWYSKWRELLTDFRDKNEDFYELLIFSDCEGMLHTQECKNLLEDFVKYQDKADKHELESFRITYKEFHEALELASHNGCLVFS